MTSNFRIYESIDAHTPDEQKLKDNYNNQLALQMQIKNIHVNGNV